MSYPKKILRLRPTRGLAPDIPPNEVSPDFYTGGSNVLFREGFAQRIGGNRQCYSQNDVNPVFRLLNVRAPGGITQTNFWIAFGTNVIKALETSNISNITGAALSAVTFPWQWAATLLNNIPCFTNGLDTPRYWQGDVGTPAANLPGWTAGTVCKSLVAFKFHLFALDIDGPAHIESQVLWSDAAAPGNVPSTWTPAATNQAGSTILADTPGPCMCGVPLQDTLIIFKRSSTYAINFVGGNQIFASRLLNGVHGALTRHSAVDIGGQIFVVADGEIYLTDGVNWQPISVARVRDSIFGQLSLSSYENLYCIFNRSRGEVWVCFPSTGNTYADQAWVYNVNTDAWGVRAVSVGTCSEVGIVNDTSPSEAWDADSNTWDSDLTAWNASNFSLAVEQIVSGHNSAILNLEEDDTLVSINASIIKQDISFDDPERFKFVRRVHLRTNGDPGPLTVRIASRDSPTDTLAYFVDQTLTPPASYVDCIVMGKFITIEVDSSGTKIWQLTGIDIEYELRGYV